MASDNAVLEEEAIKGLEELLQQLWAKGSCLLFIVEEEQGIGAEREENPKEIEQKGNVVEVKGLINQEQHCEDENSLLPPFMGEVLNLPSIQQTTLIQPYDMIEPTFGLNNSILTSNANSRIKCAELYNSLYLNSGMVAYNQNFQRSIIEPIGPIFKHCAIHAVIAYFIYGNNNCAVILYLNSRRRMDFTK